MNITSRILAAAAAIAMVGTLSAFSVSADTCAESLARTEIGASLQPAQPVQRSADEVMLPYQYDGLSTQAQRCYRNIRKAVLAHKNSVKISSRISEKTLLGIADILCCQDPLTFGTVSIEYNGISTDNAYARLIYPNTKGVDESVSSQVAKEADKVIAAFAPEADAYAKLLAVHDHITAVAQVDDSEPNSYSKAAYGPLVVGMAVSDGYAYAFQYICIRAGLTSITVAGTDADGNAHTWNKVKIGDEWYNVDCAADDISGGYGYFMVSDDIMGQTYTENSSKDYPSAKNNYNK